MNVRHAGTEPDSITARLMRLACIAALCAAGAACAPDSVRSYQATGFNSFINRLPSACQPLQIGNSDVGEMIKQDNGGDANYSYFMDITSRLYYNRVSQDSYRASLTAFMGPGSSNDRAFNCIFANLPPNRPTAPSGGAY